MTSRWNLNTANISGGVTDAALGKKVKQCYNDIEVVGSNLTLSNTNSGITKTVSVTGGGTAVQGLNSASLIGNTLSFTKTDGAAADTIDLSTSTLGGVATANSTAITTINTNLATLSGSVANNLGNITLLHSNVATNTANIVTNTTDIATNTADISALQSSGGAVDSITFNFTVQSVGGYNKYFINGEQGGLVPIELLLMHKYVFNYPASHPLRLSRTPDGTHASGIELTLGVTHLSPDGINQTQTIFVNTSMFTTNLYYYCSNHSGMGGFIMEDNGFNNIRSITYNSAVPELQIERAYAGEFSHPSETITLPNPYISSSITGQTLTLNKEVGAADTITLPSSAPSTTTVNYPTSAMTADTTGSLVASSSTSSTSPSSPAFHAFDKDATIEWISASNTYNTSNGNYVGVLIKEPQINMTSNSDSGYTCSASSTHGTAYEPYWAFESGTTTPGEAWVSAQTTWTGSAHVPLFSYPSGSYQGSANLGFDTTGGTTPDGEYIILNLVTSSTLNTVKMAQQYRVTQRTNVPKDWNVYGRTSLSGNWVLIEAFTNAIPGTSITTFNLTTPTTTQYVSFAIVTTKTNGDSFLSIQEIEFIGIEQNNLGALVIGGNTDDGEYLKLNLGSAKNATSLKIHAGTTADIKDFKLYASVNDSTWTQLISYSNTTISTTGTTYTFSNTNDYQYYAIVVSRTNNHHNVSLGEMALGVEEIVTTPPCQAKCSFVKPRDTSFTAAIAGTLSNAFNISSITQISNSPDITRFGVIHRNYRFDVTFTNALSNANYQVILSELAEFYQSLLNGAHGTLTGLSVRNKATTGFTIKVLADELGHTTYNPEFGFDIVVF